MTAQKHFKNTCTRCLEWWYDQAGALAKYNNCPFCGGLSWEATDIPLKLFKTKDNEVLDDEDLD